ncbi:alpha/beta fold hydrolase [Sphingomonas aerophila]|uniref:Pimeloyl-ACP methyl ester carboxylesterase n=1 Tax=Sphingomonas aerophila TaxID=1344948 RepID=A0A7W9BG33_9SPHN|nr:alpha/beta hydrolase [Sphingomonas aerophila]MBB5716547.1 pimeloyl-ACP methyl ester carboxylesterase [Sphingomonas aerophila]
MTQKSAGKSQSASKDESSRAPDRLAPVRRNRGWLVAGMTGAILAGAAIFNSVAARRAEAANSPGGRFVDVDGVRLHYVDRGDGPPVVLLHGNGVTLQDFEASGVLGLAAATHRVIAFDRPGFGFSERPRTTAWTPTAQADLLARALAQLGVGPAIIVGHSWGTLVALAMALNAPETVSGLVLLSGYYYGTARPDVVLGSMPAIPLFGDVIAHTTAPLTGLLTGPIGLKASFSPASVPAAVAALPVALSLRPSQIRATAADTAMMIPGAMSLSGRYGELDLPVRILAGAGDRIVHVDRHAERLVADIKGAELRIVPDQGHMLHYAVPQQVIAAINDVQKRLS